ncbi:uncharacterized protein ACWYII_037023 isoform 1-T2 [Salvelinus alpinus]|uniref:zinc finger CCCH domain-containing protein 13-like n=1 Tax=Salvelinus alpinus TaxID=8036 RepID=UPI0039FD3E36
MTSLSGYHRNQGSTADGCQTVKCFSTGMAAQVEVQTGEVERIGVGGRLHLSPLSDSSNKRLTEGPSNTQASLIITPEPSKPVPAPKPRLTPRPFAVEKNPTIRPILAPKPNTNPRPVPTHPTSYKPDSPSTPKPQQPNVTSKHRPVPINPSCPAPNSYKPSHKLSMGQTTKPVAQPFKPAPLLTLGDPSKPTPSQPVRRQKPAAAGLFQSRGPKKPPSAEWSGSTKPEKERNKTASSIRAGAASMTRAKSMGFLSQIGQDEEERKGDEGPKVTVQLRSQSRASRPRPVSAIFLPSPTQAESPTPAARWAVRRPLSADLTSKFESIGLSLHHGRPAKTDSKENTPVEPLRRTEKEKGAEGTNVTPSAPDSKPSALVLGREKKTEEEEEEDDGKGGGSIKRRISLLLDSSSSFSPVVPLRVAAQRPGSNSPVQPIQEADVTLGGVKQRIRKLTEDTVTPPAQTPAVRPQFKSRPLPPDLTKRLGSERTTDLGSPSSSEATDRHESDTDPQRRVEDSVYSFSDQKKVDEDIRGIQEQPTQTTSDLSAVLTEAGRRMESCPSSGAQTVRAALFENVVERHSVLLMEEDRAQSATKGCPKRSVSLKLGDGENDGSLVTATYHKPVSPSSPHLVEHLFDTVQAVGERRAVSESVPLAQLEDKAMTLRSRRSEGNRSARAEPVEERHAQVQGVLSLAQRRAPASQQEQGPRYLRVGVLQKWNTTEMDREAEVEKGRQREKERKEKERQREAERRMQMDVDKEKPREQEREREEVAAPKRLKMLEPDEQPPKPRATYFALTGQIQEAVSYGDEETERGDVEVPFDDFSMKSGQWGSQGKVLQVRRNPSLDEAFGKSSQGQEEDLMERNQTQERERGTAWDRRTWREELEIEKQKQVDLEKVRELEREKERQRESKEFEREKQTWLDMERQKPLEYARKRELKLKELEREKHNELENERLSERQRELERQRWQELQRESQIELERQREFEKERQRQLDLERQKEFEKERQRQLDLERQKEFEKERQRQLDLERQKEFEKERQRQLDLERQKEFEKERQRQLDLERQKEFEKERQRQLDLERQKEFEKERQRQLDLERQKEFEKERQRQLDLERQKEFEKERQRQLDLERQKEFEKERQRQLDLERQKEFEKERQRQLDLERQKEFEKERQRQLDLERQKEFEKERQRQLDLERQKEFEKERQRQLDLERQKEFEKERQRQLDLERQKEFVKERQRQLDLERQKKLDKERTEELERIKEMERRQMFEKQKQNERGRQQLLELEKQRQRERMEREEQEKMRQQAIQQEEDRQRELERERVQELERERQRDLERLKQRELERQKQLDFERQELENQRDRKRELERERQRIEELERIKEMERRQLFEFEKQKQNERERQLLHELGKQRLREKMEREEQEKMRQVAIQEEAERQRIMERQRRENQERGVLDALPLRPKMLDLDSGCWSLGDLHSRGSPHSPSVRWKQPSPWADDHYRPGILDIDSFRSQTETQSLPTREVFPVTGIQGSDPGSGVRSHPHSPEREGGHRMAPEGAVGRPSTVWAPSQQELWEQRLSIDEESVDRPMAGPEPPRKPANKPSLEQLLHRLEDRATAPILVPERRWSGMPSEPSFPRRAPHSPGSPMEQTWFPQDSEPQGHRVEARGQRRSQGSQELNRMRSRSVSRRSAPSECAMEGSLSRIRSRSVSRRSALSASAMEGSLSRIRSRSTHRERGRQSWEQLKQNVDGEEGRDMDTLVRETDSQYGTWETGLHTDDSLTPATPPSDSHPSQSPRKPTPLYTPGEHVHTPPSDLDTPDGFSAQPEIQPLPFPEASTSLLDSSALRSRVQLSKMRGPRSRPSRVSRQTAALSVHPEGQATPTEDWRSRDSTEDKVESSKKDSDSEEQARGVDPRSAAASSQPQRVALFPGMDPSALMAQLKKRSDSDNQTEGPATSPSQLSRSPKSPFLPRASRVLPPSVGKENGEEASPQWLRELKSKKRLSQYENDS